jgi:hypothetical protein
MVNIRARSACSLRTSTPSAPRTASFVIDADGGAGLVNGGDGFPDRNFFRDIRSSTIHYNGIVSVNQRNAPGGLCGNATAATNGAPNTAGAAFNCTYIFNDAGRLVQQTGTRFGTSINPSFAGGNGQTGREGKTLSVLPFTERFNFNLLSHYEVAPELELFFEAKWNRVNALGNNAGPSFIQGQVTQFDSRERPRLDNPFLAAADRTTLATAILASGCASNIGVTCPAAGNLSAADIAAVGAGTYRFNLGRNLLDVGLRDEKFQRDTMRFVGGIRGTFNEDWGYELSLNYGKFEESIEMNGYIDRQRFMLAMDAGRNPITGAIQCRSQFDPASAVPIQRTDAVSLAIAARNAGAPRRRHRRLQALQPVRRSRITVPRSTISAVLPRTPRAWSRWSCRASSRVTSSQWFELPGGPVSFAVGGEYRQEKAFYDQNTFVTDGFTNGVSIPSFFAACLPGEGSVSASFAFRC